MACTSLTSPLLGGGDYTYDVFLSFRGEDTQLGFTSYLDKALRDRGISTCFDNAEVKGRGGEIVTPSLIKAIDESRIFILVLSKNYASSICCLNELVYILEKKGRSVIPVFYNVDPSEYGQALDLHEKNYKSMSKCKPYSKTEETLRRKWKVALIQAATLSGWHFKHGDGSYEYELIEKIVDEVSGKINSAPLRGVADHPVGLNYRVLEVNWLLNDARSHDGGLKVLGICGMGGLGKTTLARAVYNSISPQFDVFCFLEDVRENSMKRGLLHLQQTLLQNIAGEKLLQLTSLHEGTLQLKHMLYRKKVLIILDDVNNLDQLRVTVGSPDNWFGCGSSVIVTTRDEHLLKSHGVDKIYQMEELAKDEALELLCWKAFKSGKIYPHYIDLLTRTANYISGHPLALEVIGSNFYGKEIDEWESALQSYQKIPYQNIVMRLKISYDALSEVEKQVFLDIACFFKGYKLSDVEYLLSAHHGYCIKYYTEVLVDKSLIKIDEHNHVKIHDLIRDMAREIVRQESPEHPGRRSRLWFAYDIVQVLEQNSGTGAIQMMILDFPIYKKVVQWDGEAFKKMKGLQTLIIRSHCFSEGPKNLPNSLRVLEWWGYPSQYLPSHFNPEKLAVLRLPHSCFMSVELSMSKKFLNMRLLNFDKCEFLTHIPDVSGAPNLEELSLVSCGKLLEIHDSVGFLDKLKKVNVEGCRKLWNFPPINLMSLEYLNLSHCSSLKSFPEILGKMKKLTHLTLEYTAIRELPYSIGNLFRLQSLALHSCGMLQLPSSIVLLPELEELSIWQCEGLQPAKEDNGLEQFSSIVSSNVKHIDFLSCNISDEFIHIGLSWFANVVELNLSSNNFTILPACIKECRLLTKLNLDYCMHLQEIGGIPPNLETFSAVRCTSLKDLDLSILLASTNEFCALRELILDDCENLQEIRGIQPNIQLLSARNCRSLTTWCRRILLNQELHEAGNKRFCLPGTQIPEWFEHCKRGHSISFWFRDKFPAISLCFIGLMHMLPICFRLVVIINGNKIRTELQTKQLFDYEFPLLTDHVLIVGERQLNFEDNMDEVLSENEWNHAVISIAIDSKWGPTELFVVWTGIHVIQQKCSMDSIRFTNPCNDLFLKEKHLLGSMGFSC